MKPGVSVLKVCTLCKKQHVSRYQACPTCRAQDRQYRAIQRDIKREEIARFHHDNWLWEIDNVIANVDMACHTRAGHDCVYEPAIMGTTLE
jgi:hypothetical protein